MLVCVTGCHINYLSSAFLLYFVSKLKGSGNILHPFFNVVMMALFSLWMLLFASAAAAAAFPHHFCVHWAEEGSVWAAAIAPPSRGSLPRSEGWATADSASHSPPLLLGGPERPRTPSCLRRRLTWVPGKLRGYGSQSLGWRLTATPAKQQEERIEDCREIWCLCSMRAPLQDILWLLMTIGSWGLYSSPSWYDYFTQLL